jgi:hypothetical protein
MAMSLVGSAWAVAVALGLRMLVNYETKPGEVGAVPTS